MQQPSNLLYKIFVTLRDEILGTTFSILVFQPVLSFFAASSPQAYFICSILYIGFLSKCLNFVKYIIYLLGCSLVLG